jgi:hypothetical protein
VTSGLDTWEQQHLVKDEERLTIESLHAVHARGPMRLSLPPVMGSLTHDGE